MTNDRARINVLMQLLHRPIGDTQLHYTLNIRESIARRDRSLIVLAKHVVHVGTSRLANELKRAGAGKASGFALERTAWSMSGSMTD